MYDIHTYKYLGTEFNWYYADHEKSELDQGSNFHKDILPPGFTTEGKKLLIELSGDDELQFKPNKA